MDKQIEVDDEVWAHLQERAEPLVDTPNSVIRRFLGLRSSDVDGARAETAATQGRARQRGSRRKRHKSGTTRAPAGSLLASEAYELPILRVLDGSPTGQLPAREVTMRVGELVDDRLKDLDREQLESGAIRWENRVQFARLRLVDRGLLKKGSPRGVWEISDEGRGAASGDKG